MVDLQIIEKWKIFWKIDCNNGNGWSNSAKTLKYSLGIETIAYTTQIGQISSNPLSYEKAKLNRYTNDVRCPDLEIAEKMKSIIIEARKNGDSLGGIVDCISVGLPVGLGEPIFSSMESDLSKALFSIPSVKAIEFGSGFSGTKLKGSENNDEYTISEDNKIITKTNNSGGILGGLTNGMPLVMRIGFKPASSIAKKQNSRSVSNSECEISARSDPCVVPRAIPVVESLVSFILADHAIRWKLIPPVLSDRKK
jgi:chorismate synthase